MIFKCHNCGVGRSLANFLKDQDNNLHDQYVMERYKNGLTGKGSNTPNPVFNFPKPKFKEHDICSELTKVSDLKQKNISLTERLKTFLIFIIVQTLWNGLINIRKLLKI